MMITTQSRPHGDGGGLGWRTGLGLGEDHVLLTRLSIAFRGLVLLMSILCVWDVRSIQGVA